MAAAAIPWSFHSFRPGSRGPSGGRASGPNVLFITADDIGWLDLSCYGNSNVKTPHLDSLANQGIKFDRAFGVSSSCSASRASFITGQYISTHGVDGLTHRHLSKQLSPSRRTLPDYFSKTGYHTAIHGKWHVATYLPASLYGYQDSLSSPLPWKKHIKNTKKIERYFQARAQDGNSFYLELNLTDTHRSASGVFESDPDFVVNPETITVPEWMGLPNWPEIRSDLALYYGKLLRTDYLVGEILKGLEKHGHEQNTIVVFVSDNGSPFPGNKMTLLDRGIGTPLLMRYPGKIASGRVSDAMVSTIDIMPTILDLCQIPIASQMEGRSFAPLLEDEKVDQHREYICSEMNYHVKRIPMRAIRDERWKAIENLSDSPVGLDDLNGVDWAMKLCERKDQPWLRSRPPFELYDLESDPHETRNLAGLPEFASIEAKFRRQLKADWNRIKA